MLRMARSTKWARTGLLCAMLPLGGLAFYAPRSICEVAAEWAADRGSAQVSFDEMAALPTEFQRALLAQLPDADRVRLWTDQLDSFLEEPSELTPKQLRTRTLLPSRLTPPQRDLLLEVRANLSRLVASSTPVGQQFLAFARYQARANLLFSNRSDFDRITARIGTDLSVADRDELIAKLQSEVMHPGEPELRALSWRVIRSLDTPPQCNCNGLFSCAESSLCLQTSPPCTEGDCNGTAGGGWCSGGVCRAVE